MNQDTLNIIHDANRFDREELFMREMADQEIYNYHVWPAVFDERATFAGISMAHKKIVRHAKQNKYPYVIISEDDLRFTAKGAYQYFLSKKPEDFDIYLAGIYTGDIKDDNTVDDWSGLTLYCVNERFYDIFLEQTVFNHLDRQLARQGKYVVCNPFAAYQFTTYSDNKKSTVNHFPLLKGRKFWNPGKVNFTTQEMIEAYKSAQSGKFANIFDFFKQIYSLDISHYEPKDMH